MKIKKINDNQNKWFDLNEPLEVMTPIGKKKSRKFYFNGFKRVFELCFSDKSVYQFTNNHKLKDINGRWIEVENMEIGEVFINSLYLLSKKDIGIMPTMDMEVEDAHEYILQNGIHSHNSSFILGQVSPSIEPQNSNYYVKKLAKGSFTYKNPFLKKLLKEKDKDNEEIWRSILVNGGSVQHLECLTDEEKDVFKTFGEISQKEIVIQAAQRQKYIDQSQSLNFMIPYKTKPKEVSELMIEAWRLGVKTLYYQRSTSPAQELGRSILTCKSCEA
jgi:hypothetical protein